MIDNIISDGDFKSFIREINLVNVIGYLGKFLMTNPIVGNEKDQQILSEYYNAGLNSLESLQHFFKEKMEGENFDLWKKTVISYDFRLEFNSKCSVNGETYKEFTYPIDVTHIINTDIAELKSQFREGIFNQIKNFYDS